MIIPYQTAQVSFRKIEEIGQEGRNSKVYRVHDEYLDAELVIKEIVKDKDFSASSYFEEAQCLYKSAHPNVVQVCYACEDEDRIYIATPYYKKGSLKKLMSTGYLTVKEIVCFSVQILNGLHNVHSKGLIHFDVKPDNILISDRGEGLLSDFGQSKPMGIHGLAQQHALYDKQFPPEVFGNENNVYDNRFDIYQMGLTMYRMCVGDASFYSQINKYSSWDSYGNDVRSEKFPDRKAYPLHIPRKLRQVINKCLRRNPGDRYGSPIEVVNALADVDGGLLHWKYEVTVGQEKWTQTVEGVRRSMEVSGSNESTAYKHGEETSPRKVQKFCKESITEDEIMEFLQS